MSKDEFMAHVKDRVLFNVRLQAGNNQPKMISFPCLFNVTVGTWSSGRTHVGGEAYFKNPYNDNQLEKYHFYSVIDDVDNVKDLIFELSSGVIPREFWQ